MVVCFEIEENLEKKSNSLGLARCIIYVRYVNGSKIKICQLVKQIFNENFVALEQKASERSLNKKIKLKNLRNDFWVLKEIKW